MHSQAHSLFKRFVHQNAPFRAALVLGSIAALSFAAMACSGDDDDDADTTRAGGLATSTVASKAGANSSPVRVGGTLVPLNTATPEPGASPSASGGSPADPAAVVEMADLAPCGAETYFEEQTLDNGVHAITYKDVPEGTPILFPFEEGRLLTADAREGAILLVYEIEDIGVFSVQAAGSHTLDRNVAHATKGEVIGHFAGTFGEEETDVFEGHQLFALVGHTELVRIGDQLFRGEALDPEITGCLVLP